MKKSRNCLEKFQKMPKQFLENSKKFLTDRWWGISPLPPARPALGLVCFNQIFDQGFWPPNSALQALDEKASFARSTGTTKYTFACSTGDFACFLFSLFFWGGEKLLSFYRMLQSS